MVRNAFTIVKKATTFVVILLSLSAMYSWPHNMFGGGKMAPMQEDVRAAEIKTSAGLLIVRHARNEDKDHMPHWDGISWDAVLCRVRKHVC